MKKILFLTIIWLFVVIYIVFRTVGDSQSNQQVETTLNAIKSTGCGSSPARSEGLSTSPNPSLRRLGELEQKCNTSATDSLMHFTIMPKDSKVAKELAQQMAQDLVEYSQHSITPIVIVEPDSDWGLVDFTEFNSGFWDSWIKDYFSELKNQGVTDEMMGVWVPFPEANLPFWNHQNTSPDDFSKAVNRYLGILRAEFPDTKTSILLNSATYETDDYNWADGEYRSLRPYVEDLDPELIDSFGLQGLPWMPPANESGQPIFDPNEYLNSQLAREAADIIGTKTIWFNTGSFAAKYTQDEEIKVIVPADIRKQMLEKVLQEALELKRQGYSVSINLFAEDKSNTPEATDWSYWGSNYTQRIDHELALLDFLREARQSATPVSFYLR